MAEYEGNFIIVGGILFFVTAFFNVLFYRISVIYIEKELAKAGFEPPEWDKGIGARGAMYAQQILFKIKDSPFFDGEAVVRIARRKDWWLAFLSFCSLVLFTSVMAIAYYLYAPVDF